MQRETRVWSLATGSYNQVNVLLQSLPQTFSTPFLSISRMRRPRRREHSSIWKRGWKQDSTGLEKWQHIWQCLDLVKEHGRCKDKSFLLHVFLHVISFSIAASQSVTSHWWMGTIFPVTQSKFNSLGLICWYSTLSPFSLIPWQRSLVQIVFLVFWTMSLINSYS